MIGFLDVVAAFSPEGVEGKLAGRASHRAAEWNSMSGTSEAFLNPLPGLLIIVWHCPVVCTTG